MKRVALYIRGRKDELFIQTRQELKQIASANDWLGSTYFEEENGGLTWPVKAKLLHQLRNHYFNGLLIPNLNSWARNSTELILELDEFIRAGIFVYSVSENLFLKPGYVDPGSQIIKALVGFERAWIGEKRRKAIEISKYSGKKMGRPKGSKDRTKRKTEGYYIREARKRYNM